MTSSVFGDAEPDEWAPVRSGDAAAFGVLFALHRERVLWQAMRSVRSFHDDIIDGAIQRIQVGPKSVLPPEYCPA
jgi:hypothetical protein